MLGRVSGADCPTLPQSSAQAHDPPFFHLPKTLLSWSHLRPTFLTWRCSSIAKLSLTPQLMYYVVSPAYLRHNASYGSCLGHKVAKDLAFGCPLPGRWTATLEPSDLRYSCRLLSGIDHRRGIAFLISARRHFLLVKSCTSFAIASSMLEEISASRGHDVEPATLYKAHCLI